MSEMTRAVREPPCWHRSIGPDGFCDECGARAAINIKLTKREPADVATVRPDTFRADALALAEDVNGFVTQEFGTGKLIWPTRAQIRKATELARKVAGR